MKIEVTLTLPTLNSLVMQIWEFENTDEAANLVLVRLTSSLGQDRERFY